jgi:hypothetical protein
MKFYHFQDVFLLKYYGFEVYFCVYLVPVILQKPQTPELAVFIMEPTKKL